MPLRTEPPPSASPGRLRLSDALLLVLTFVLLVGSVALLWWARAGGEVPPSSSQAPRREAPRHGVPNE